MAGCPTYLDHIVITQHTNELNINLLRATPNVNETLDKIARVREAVPIVKTANAIEQCYTLPNPLNSISH
jgi:hypothetical protein